MRHPCRFMLCMMALAITAMLLASCAQRVELPPVRDSVNDYSWEELSDLSAAIADASDEAAALDIAVRYHLALPDGTLDGGQAKVVELLDGTTTRAIVIGFNHDAKAEGGMAGITFMLADSIAERPMNNGADAGDSDLGDAYAIGGWQASDVRYWLNGDFRSALPADLDAVVASVEKTTAAVPEFELGGVSDEETVDYTVEQVLGKTVDRFWLPSVAEVSGVDDSLQAASDRPGWMTVLRAEGSQYQLFADGDVAEEEEANQLLVRATSTSGNPCAWWLRSVENGSFAYVRVDGSIDREDSADAAYPAPDEALGIVFCFAI